MSDHAASSPAPAQFEHADTHLRKAMSFQQLLFLSLGTIIGSGWLLASVAAASVAGPAAIFSWIIGGIFILLIALPWAEIAGLIPRTGAIVRYPAITHGSLTAWMMGWAYWFPVGPAAETIAVLTYLSGRFPQAGLTYTSQGLVLLSWPNGILCGFGFMCLFFVLNYVGIRFLAEWNRWFTWWKIVIPILTFCFLFVAFKSSNLTAHGGFLPSGPGSVFQALSTTGLVFAYLGFRQALEYGGEAKNPQRDIPLATIGGVLIAIVIYTLLQVAFLGALNWHAAGVAPGDWAKLATSTWGKAPLYSALEAANIGALGAFGTVLIIDAAVSPTGTSWLSMGTNTRTFYGLSVTKNFPRIFQRMNRFGIPWVSLVGAFVIGLVFFLPIPSWRVLVSFITSTSVMTLMIAGVGLLALRRFAPTMHRPFTLPTPWLLAPLSFLAALLLMYWAGFATLVNVFAAIFIGLPIYGAYFSWRMGYVRAPVGAAISIVFLVTWVWINHMGGWALSITGSAPAGSWPFPVYDIAFSADVVFFLVALWLASTPTGRMHIERGLWLVFLLLASFPVSYYGFLGPLGTPALGFPWGTLVEAGVGLVGYVWAAYSGFVTDDMRGIVHAAGTEIGRGPLALLPGRRATAGGERPQVV